MRLPILLILSVMGSAWAEKKESVAEKIMKKIASAFEKTVIRAGNTCGLPKIDNVMKNLTLTEGNTARFQCDVNMKCMVSYIQWYHQEFDNNGSARLLRTAATMGNPFSYIIKDISYPDEGFYSCVAGNTLGETVSSAYLEIAAATLNILDIRIVTLALVVTVMGVR